MRPPESQNAVHAGFAKVCITPAVGSPLAGFAARTEVSQEVADELYVRALALAGEAEAAILAVVDVLALSARFTLEVRQRIAARTGVAVDGIVIAATHTHSGPVTIRTFFNPDESVDEAYMARLADAVVDAASTAWAARTPARVGTGAGRVEGIAVNRREPDGVPVDPEVGVLRVEDASGRLRGVLFNYACHLTVLGPTNLRISGDLGAAAIAGVENACGNGVFAMFLNAAEGNVSVGHSPLLSAIGAAPPRTPEMARELGQRLAGAVVATLPSIGCAADVPVAVRSARLRLPLRARPSIEEAEEALARARQSAAESDSPAARIDLLNCTIQLNNARYIARLGGEEEAELTAIGIGDCALAAAPGELFVETALSLKARAPGQVMVAGLSNGYLGYIPTREAFARGGYEVVAARSAPGAAEQIADELLALVRSALATAGVVS